MKLSFSDLFVSFCKKDEKVDKPGAITPAKVLTDVEQLGYKRWVVLMFVCLAL